MVTKGYIVVIDDDVEFLKLFKKLLMEYLGFEENEILLLTEYDKEKLSQIKVDLVFIDIELLEVNGIDVALDLNKRADKPYLFFCTNKVKYMPDTFIARPLNFIKKQDIKNGLKTAKHMLNEVGFRAVTNIKFENEIININDVMYIKSFDHYIHFFMRDGTLKKIYFTLNEAYDILEAYNFKRLHRSYIVNFRYVNDYSFKKIELKNNEKLTVSRKYVKEIETFYDNWSVQHV